MKVTKQLIDEFESENGCHPQVKYDFDKQCYVIKGQYAGYVHAKDRQQFGLQYGAGLRNAVGTDEYIKRLAGLADANAEKRLKEETEKYTRLEF